MIGFMHRLLLSAVERKAGKDQVTLLLQQSGLPGDAQFEKTLPYPEELWRELFAGSCELLKLSREELEWELSFDLMEEAKKFWSPLFKTARCSRDFLKLQPHIHLFFANSIADARTREAALSKFGLDERGDSLVVHYSSPNQHCGLYKAIVCRLGEHFQDEVRVVEHKCLKRGDEECELHLFFEQLEKEKKKDAQWASP